MAKLVVKDRHLKNTCYDEYGPCGETTNMRVIIKEEENLHFDSL